MNTILENIDLTSYNSFGLAVRARYFLRVESLDALREAVAFCRQKQLAMVVLGGGSNVLLREDFPGLVIQIALQGISAHESPVGVWRVTAASGENWHRFVEYCLEQHMHGLENLALIPGCVGAAPMQNIGAYGVEVKDFITDVQVFDIATGELETLTNAECHFAYRDSVFKGALRGQKLVLSVSFQLRRQATPNLTYAALAQAVAGKGDALSARDVFDAVCAIRREKLPDPKVLGNAGSFFKNPVVSDAQYAELLQTFPDLPSFDVAGHAQWRKLPAAWLIERAGWKGKGVGGAAVYEKQALVIVNRDHASAQDVVSLALEIIASVEQKFGVTLEPEVQWIPGLQNSR